MDIEKRLQQAMLVQEFHLFCFIVLIVQSQSYFRCQTLHLVLTKTTHSVLFSCGIFLETAVFEI